MTVLVFVLACICLSHEHVVMISIIEENFENKKDKNKPLFHHLK